MLSWYLKKVTLLACVCLIIGLIFYDARKHFDQNLIGLKRQHDSAQQNWNIFFSQANVFKHSSVRYQQDLKNILGLIRPNQTIMSDLATSYYVAATLPAYVVNVHRHQGRYMRRAWAKFLDKRYACYQEFEENQEKLNKFILDRQQQDKVGSHLNFGYILLNLDTLNINLRKDCLAFRKHILIEAYKNVAELIYAGEYLYLYQLDSK